MEFLLTVVLLILIIIFITLFTNSILGPFLNTKIELLSSPKVSLLIPARNEEENIAQCLEHLANQNYKNLEIIVLDDESSDRTAEIVGEIQKEYPIINIINGEALPDGWTGKNWACHQLAENASGEILIFTDADTMHSPVAISRTLGWMQKFDLGLLSAFPQQKTETFVEKLIVPVIDFFVYGLLPLWATYYFRSAAFAAANGQWIAFKREAYLRIKGHESVKNEIVEDVELNRMAKQSGIKTLTTAGTNTIFCRMYHSPNEVWQGFSKNFYGLTGHSTFVFLIIETLLLGCCVLPFVLWLINPSSIILISIITLNLIIRALLSIRFKHPFLVSVFLHPFSILLATFIGINSFYQYHWGHFQWKDRKIKLKNSKIVV